MKPLERLDRIIRPIAIPNLTVVIIAAQVVFWIMGYGDATLFDRMSLVWDKVLQGEVWRIITFLLIPPLTNPIFMLFYFLIFHMMGTGLEQAWGTVRYNSYFYLGAVLSLLAATIVHDAAVTGGFLAATVFLAFATYNPNFQLMLFFVLPVKIKWLAMLQGFGYAVALVGGPLPTKLMVAASIGNYLIFFAPMMWGRSQSFVRQTQWKARQLNTKSTPRHVCAVCGIDSNTHPQADFRYCSKCNGELAYCEEHLKNHQHVA